jgi:cell division protein FtsI (penicillin-binding protein 3)
LPNARAYILCTAILLGFALLGVRLGDLMLFDHDIMEEKARFQRLKKKRLKAGRGIIYDRRGRELAVNVEAFSVYSDPRKVRDPEATARVLSDATGREYPTLLNLLKSEKKFVWISRKLDKARAESIRNIELPGIGFVPELKRYYPKGSLASHIVGFVGVDNQPLEGIELEYDAVLRGEDKKVQLIRDAGGRTLSEGVDVEIGARSVVLTIDEGLQYIVERELRGGIEKWSARAGSAIMMDPYTGEVLAMANYPLYDLNDPGGSRVSHRRNRALIDPYEPGSTFKVVTASAVLESGAASFETTVDASNGYIDVGGMRIWDTRNKGVLSFKDVIKTSSNVGTILVGQMLEPERLYEYVRKFGFGQRTGIDLPGENTGLVRKVSRWSETSQAAVSIGYEVAVTPLQVLRAYSAVANGGVLVRPRVVADVLTPEGLSIHRFDIPGAGSRERILLPATAEKLRQVLVSVTEDGGTARAASIDGNSVAGKTGTTRLIDPGTGTYSKERYVSSFVGFVPADKPRVAMIVVIYEPKDKYYGGVVAAPVFRSIADQSLAYLNVPRDDSMRDNVLLVQKREGAR